MEPFWIRTGASRATIRLRDNKNWRLDSLRVGRHIAASFAAPFCESIMKIRNSLKSAKTRDKNCRVVRRHGRVYVINKKNPRMKARQG